MVRHKIISIAIALAICLGPAGSSAAVSPDRITHPAEITVPDTSLASTYQVLGERNISTNSGRKGKEWCVRSSAESFEARAQTAIQAALDLAQKSGADYVSVKLTPIPRVGCSRYIAASATYFPNAGIQSAWKVSASSIDLGPEETLVAIAWEEARPEIEVNGHVDPDKMSKYLSKQLNLTPEQVKTYWIRCLEMGMALRPYTIKTFTSVPAAPAPPTVSNVPASPAAPTVPNIPKIQTIQPVPAVPTVPDVPDVPASPPTPNAPKAKPPA